MSSPGPWKLHVVKSAEKELAEAGAKDSKRLKAALEAMQFDPYSGDIAKLKGEKTAWRRRVGSWRILYDLFPEQHLIVVAAIRRRTSTSY